MWSLDGGGSTGDAEETAGRVGPVWAKVDENVLRGYVQRENSTGGGTAAEAFGGQIR